MNNVGRRCCYIGDDEDGTQVIVAEANEHINEGCEHDCSDEPSNGISGISGMGDMSASVQERLGQIHDPLLSPALPLLPRLLALLPLPPLPPLWGVSMGR